MTSELIPMLRTWRKPPTLFSDFNTLQFASVMGLIILVPVLLALSETRPHNNKIVSVDLPKAHHSVPMPGFHAADAIVVSVTRDGVAWLGSDRVPPSSLPQRIADRLRDHDIERKVYIKADRHARWGEVKGVLEEVRRAEVVRVAFLVN